MRHKIIKKKVSVVLLTLLLILSSICMLNLKDDTAFAAGFSSKEAAASKYTYVVLGNDGKWHGSNKSADAAASYGGGAASGSGSSSSGNSSNGHSSSGTSSSNVSKDVKSSTVSTTGKSYEEMTSTYKYVVLGDDGYLHGSNKSLDAAKSYDGGAQVSPVDTVSGQLKENENQGYSSSGTAWNYTNSEPKNKNDIYLVGSDVLTDSKLKTGLGLPQTATLAELCEALGQAKSDKGNDNDYVSTIGYTNFKNIVSDVQPVSTGYNRNYRDFTWIDDDPEKEIVKDNPVFKDASISHSQEYQNELNTFNSRFPKYRRTQSTYWSKENLYFEIRFSCKDVTNYIDDPLCTKVYVKEKNVVHTTSLTLTKGDKLLVQKGSIPLNTLSDGKTYTLVFENKKGASIAEIIFKVSDKAVPVLKSGYPEFTHTTKWLENIRNYNKRVSASKKRSETGTYWIGEKIVIVLKYDCDNLNNYYTEEIIRNVIIKDGGKALYTIPLPEPEKGNDVLVQKAEYFDKSMKDRLKNRTYDAFFENEDGEVIKTGKITFDSTTEYFMNHGR